MLFSSSTDINFFLKNYYVNSGLYGNPIPIKEQEQGTIQCIYFWYSDVVTPVEYSVVMPVHNQGDIIRRNLEALVQHTVGSYEILMILDACDDSTREEVLGFFSRGSIANGLKRVIVLESSIPLFETICDNIGFRMASGKWLLEIQADMYMTQHGYNETLRRPFIEYPNAVIAVSGRCCHSLDQQEVIGRGGLLIEKTVAQLEIDRDVFYVHEACNRGPLLIDSEKAKAIGYLDEMNYYLDYSEIDMMLRAYEQYRWLSGYIGIDFDTPLEHGTTRKPRNELNEYILNIRKERCTGGFIKEYIKRGTKRRLMVLPLAP